MKDVLNTNIKSTLLGIINRQVFVLQNFLYIYRMDGDECVGIEFNDPSGNLGFLGYDGSFSRFIFMTEPSTIGTQQITGPPGNVVLGQTHATEMIVLGNLDVSGIDVSNNITVGSILGAGKVSARDGFWGKWEGNIIPLEKLAPLTSRLEDVSIKIGTTEIILPAAAMDLSGLESVSAGDLSCNTIVAAGSISCPEYVFLGTEGKIRFRDGSLQGYNGFEWRYMFPSFSSLSYVYANKQNLDQSYNIAVDLINKTTFSPTVSSEPWKSMNFDDAALEELLVAAVYTTTYAVAAHNTTLDIRANFMVASSTTQLGDFGPYNNNPDQDRINSNSYWNGKQYFSGLAGVLNIHTVTEKIYTNLTTTLNSMKDNFLGAATEEDARDVLVAAQLAITHAKLFVEDNGIINYGINVAMEALWGVSSNLIKLYNSTRGPIAGMRGSAETKRTAWQTLKSAIEAIGDITLGVNLDSWLGDGVLLTRPGPDPGFYENSLIAAIQTATASAETQRTTGLLNAANAAFFVEFGEQPPGSADYMIGLGSDPIPGQDTAQAAARISPINFGEYTHVRAPA